MPELNRDNKNLQQAHKIIFSDGDAKQSYTLIPAIGDGNCALGAFALGLVNGMLAGKRISNVAALAAAMKEKSNIAALKKRLDFYRSGDERAYSDLANELENWINFFEKHDYSYATFIAALKRIISLGSDEEKRKKLAALHIAMAPALRMLTTSQSLTFSNHDCVADKCKQDATPLDPVHLRALADYFDVDFTLFTRSAASYVYGHELNQGREYRISILAETSGGDHYDYMMPSEVSTLNFLPKHASNSSEIVIKNCQYSDDPTLLLSIDRSLSHPAPPSVVLSTTSDTSVNFHTPASKKKIKTALVGTGLTLDETRRIPSQGDPYYLVKKDKEEKFKILPDALKTENAELATFVAMLKVYQATYGDIVPEITTEEGLKQIWREAYVDVYKKAAPEALFGHTPAPGFRA